MSSRTSSGDGIAPTLTAVVTEKVEEVAVSRFFNTIPNEAVKQILGHVNVRDVYAVAGTCSRLNVCLHHIIPLVLRRSGIDINGGEYLVRFATQGNVEGIKGLVAAGANVDQETTENGTTSLMVASENGHVEVVKALVAAGANVDQATTDDGRTSLMLASRNRHVEVVKALVAAGANVDQAMTDDGSTSLM